MKTSSKQETALCSNLILERADKRKRKICCLLQYLSEGLVQSGLAERGILRAGWEKSFPASRDPSASVLQDVLLAIA